MMLSNEISKSEKRLEKRIEGLERKTEGLEKKVEGIDGKVEVGFKSNHEEIGELRERQGKLEKYVTLVTKRDAHPFDWR